MLKLTAAVIAVIAVVVSASTLNRHKRQASYLLPDGVDLLLDRPLTTNFRCNEAGYYADIDNDCKIFHVCDISVRPDNVEEIRQYSFACPNTTMFNQFTLTCADERDSIPCAEAQNFFAMNARIGKENELFHTDADVEDAARYIPSRNAPAK